MQLAQDRCAHGSHGSIVHGVRRMLLSHRILPLHALLACAASAPVRAGDACASPIARVGTSSSLPLVAAIGKIWDHPCYLEGLNPRCTAIGSSGTIVFTDMEGVNTFTRTLSSFDATPAGPVAQSGASAMRRHAVVRSADATDVRVDLAYVQASAGAPTFPIVAKSSFMAAEADWTYSFPFSFSDAESLQPGLGISRDGQVIVACAYNRVPGRLAIAVFHPGSSAPSAYQDIQTFFEPMNYALSSDGSTFVVISQLYTLVYDVAHDVVTFNANSEFPYGGLAVSRDGSRFAKSLASDHRIDVYAKQAGVYAIFATYPDHGFGQAAALAMSDDGSTLVAAYANPPSTVTPVVLDISAPLPRAVYQDSIVGDGPFWNSVRDLVLAPDGATFGLALTGSLSGVTPQLQAYARDPASGAWSNVLQATLRGSALDVDLSADGTKIAVASMRGHWDAPLGGGEISLFRVRAQDLEAHGVPAPSAHVELDYEPASPPNVGAAVALLESPVLANHASVFPGIGTLYLDRMLAHSVGVGHIDASGVASVGLNLPSSSASIGTTNFYQALCLSPRRLSETWVRVTIVP